MPFNVAAGNSSGYNYASGRLDHQTYYKSIRVDQAQIGLVVMDRVLRAWLDEAILISDFLPLWLRTAAFRDLAHQWFWDGQEHVDPAKEANAQATRLANHTTTLAFEYARQGRDWESELPQRAKEAALMQELGLTPIQAQAQGGLVVPRCYVPQRGDVAWLQFTPRAGREQAGRRPALVISPRAYNEKVGLALFCPITSHIKGYPFEVVLPRGLRVSGAVVTDQIKSLDWQARKAKRAGTAPRQVVDDVLAEIALLVEKS